MDDIEDSFWLTKTQTALRLNISVRTLDRWYCQGIGPLRYNNGEIIRYKRIEVDAWVAGKDVK